MRRRALLIVAGLVIMAGLSLLVLRWAMTPTPGVTRANFERLHGGMTLEEIEAIMGRPADRQFYNTGSTTYVWYGLSGGVRINQGGGESSGALVLNDRSRTLYNGDELLQLAPAPETFLGCLRRWLRL